MQEPVKYCVFAGSLNLLQKMENFLMKKLNCILAVAAFFLCGVVLGGCSSGDTEIFGPSDTWCTMPVTYASDNGQSSTTLNVTFYYASKNVVPNGTRTGLRSNIESIPAGSLSVLVTLGSGTNGYLTALTSTQYLFKSYGSMSDVATEAGGSYSYSNMKLLWKAIYLKNFAALSKDQSSSIPEQLQKTKEATYSSITELENFNWKRLLATYLLNNLE